MRQLPLTTPSRERTDERPALWQLIREDLASHNGDWSSPGFRALAVHRFGAWVLRERPFLRGPLYYLSLALHRFVRNHYGIDLFATVTVGRRVVIAHHGAIVIHPHAVIGDGCVIRQGVTIGGAVGGDERPPVLERDVELGAGAIIAGPVTIGERARIGPNAVVTQDVPAGAVLFAPHPRTIYTRRHGEQS